MDKLKQNLKTLGLTEEEIIIYVSALEQGSTTVLELARTTKIPRTTVYLLIDSLTEKGLFQLTAEGKKKLYVPTSPEELIILAKTKHEQLDQTITSLKDELPQLQALYNLTHQKPKIRYYEGVEEVKKIYEDTLSAEKIYVHCMSQHAIPIIGEYLEKYFVRVIRKMIHTKEIVSDSEVDKKYQKEYATSRNQIICIPKQYITNTDYMIYGTAVAFITYKDQEPIGVVICDPEIAQFEKIRFMMIWERFCDIQKSAQ